MTKTFFLSHNQKDEQFVLEVANKLGRDDCWVFQWETRGTDSVFKFDRGIADSKIFVLFWSVHASKSKWVEEEVNEGRYRWITERGYRPIIIRLDDTPLPLFLKYRNYLSASKGIDYVVQEIIETKKDLTPSEIFIGKPESKESFQNREDELDKLEEIVTSGLFNGVLILGLDGFGKTTFLQKAYINLFSEFNPIWVDLKIHSTPIRLLSSIAKPFGLSIDTEFVGIHPIEFWKDVLLPEIANSQKTFLIFDNFSLPGRDPKLKGQVMVELIQTICSDLSDIRKKSNPNIILLSYKFPDLADKVLAKFGKINVGSLDKKYVKRALRYHLNFVSSIEYDDKKLDELSEKLRGYPLAISLAANKIAEQGIDVVLDDRLFLKKMIIELAQDLFSGLDISSDERQILIILAASSYPLNKDQLNKILGDKWKAIGNLIKKQLLDWTSKDYRLHPIIGDYVISSMATSDEILIIHSKLADLFNEEWRLAPPKSAQAAQYGSLTYYHSIVAGKIDQARNIQRDYLIEAKDAAIELYRRRQYKVALAYLANALEMTETFDPIYEYYYALCLNKTGKRKEAIVILEKLIEKNPNISRYYHSLGSIQRRLNKYDDALITFRKSVALAHDKGKIVPLVSLADLLFEMSHKNKQYLSEAKNIILQVLNNDSTDSEVVSIAAKILFNCGESDRAIKILSDALQISPTDTHLQHRVGMILKEMGEFKGAIKYLKVAAADPQLSFSITALADVYLRLGDIENAEKALEKFEGNRKFDPGYLVTEGNIFRHKSKFKEAEEAFSKAIQIAPKDPIPYGGMAQLKFDLVNSSLLKGSKQEALIFISETELFLKKGLDIDPDNEGLLEIEHNLNELKQKYGLK